MWFCVCFCLAYGWTWLPQIIIRVLKTLGSCDPGSWGRFHKVRKVQLPICAFFLSISLSNLTRLALPLPKSLTEPQQTFISHDSADKKLFQVITEVLFIRFCFKSIKILTPVLCWREEGLTCPNLDPRKDERF
jgi:hypothetical protein